MPHLTATCNSLAGPLVPVFVGVSGPFAAVLKAKNEPPPLPQLAKCLIDTGASCTVLDPWILQTLNLKPTGQTKVHTPSTAGIPVTHDLFDVGLHFFDGTRHLRSFTAVQVAQSSLKPQGIDGLIGRDVLAEAVLIYDGRYPHFTLAL